MMHKKKLAATSRIIISHVGITRVPECSREIKSGK
jgi:hypothetical protein